MGHFLQTKPRCAQVISQRLAFLRKHLPHQPQETDFFHAQFRNSRRKPPAKHGGMHVRRRRERTRRQREKLLYRPKHLHRHRQQPVVSRPRPGCNPVGYLPLHHQDRPVQRRVARRQLQQDLRCNVVRQVAHHQQPLPGPRSRSGKVEVQHILFHHRDPLSRELRPQVHGQPVIQFHSHNMRRPRSQCLGDRSGARPNLYHYSFT